MNRQPGRLFYVMGPSGAGKDSFLQLVRTRLPAELLVAHRYITRAAFAGGENHVELSLPEFQRRRELGLFALDWQANGHCYALGCELDSWLASGLEVMVNGSRACLPQARERFGERLVPVLVTVDGETLGKRLRARGRENEAEIRLRLARARAHDEGLPDSVWRLDNSGSLQQTLQQFEQYRRGERACD
ncbi:ribose 1,5-bisphosphokinase [Oceanimonas pelagia]|uniref:Ribose 1,5-bisphosphate phosphokinase PhnN n=1 Tax=Oceanimonas pelagia TaxID=3028314 RepID=A0AA50KPU2_9GAMM|nr:ribose 1,5-bisphosphokinase [Oceanimonas pelagia]WMC10917.1 ribose 1,5-bisphosphokinase [Oceanimonas pelagia]